jgi:ssDNA-binding Zn-finger/Zn-ribbon topoisomerase 1
MTHTRQMDDSEGTFEEWKPDAAPCPKCGGHVLCRLWGSHDEAYEDHQYRCIDCKYTWWVDGIDS